MVEMQLTARSYEPGSWDRDQEQDPGAPQTDAMGEYEARRCHICRGKYPPFGFGPPLQTAGRVIWSCAGHRAEVDRMVSGMKTTADAGQGRRL